MRTEQQKQTAQHYLKQIWQILAGESITAEQAQLQTWWNGRSRVERSAFFNLAGINHGNTGKAWLELSSQHRAALVLTLDKFAKETSSLVRALATVRKSAIDALQQEAYKASQPRITRKEAA
jgi:hypothetical protein